MDLLDGSVDDAAREHVSGCEGCQERVATVGDGLVHAHDAEVPEPPPLYWEAFRRQIGRQIEGAETTDRQHLRWWPGLAAAALLLALLGGLRSVPVPGTSPLAPVAPVPAWSALPPVEEDTGLGVLSGLESADLGSTAECRDAAECVVGLSDEESQALAEALRGEIRGGVL
jgi:hypothetical protein